MSRQLKPISVAFRNLLTKHGKDLTHSEAVPLLVEIGKAEGFEVAQPASSAEEFLEMNKWQIDWDDEASVQSVGAHCNLDAEGIERALKFRAWKRQEAAFNAVKHTWFNQSGKAKTIKVKTEKQAKATKPVQTPIVDDLDEIAALKFVEEHGNLICVQDMLTKAKAEAAYLTKVLELYEKLNARLQAAGNVGKKSKVA